MAAAWTASLVSAFFRAMGHLHNDGQYSGRRQAVFHYWLMDMAIACAISSITT
jgi:hypothetical protein